MDSCLEEPKTVPEPVPEVESEGQDKPADGDAEIEDRYVAGCCLAP